ncbi:MAG: hypothetical protein A2162_02285 [Deltaproteobacteria bacterium RBG_13_52_11b]|nr:MAG: hypothetical protein A2162_02285 [Deltaproteobacteria bacterium RBG_13_52_11b]
MKHDRYLRIILTIIAVCLVWICVRDIAVGPSSLIAGTNGRSNGVWVDGGELDVTVTRVNGLTLGLCEPIQVEIANPETIAARAKGPVNDNKPR